jgi:transcriptional regulator NrdR family protein
MKCKCQLEADCIDSRAVGPSRRRRYKCQCGVVFTTIELREDVNRADLASMDKKTAAYQLWNRIEQQAFSLGESSAQARMRRALGIESTEHDS